MIQAWHPKELWKRVGVMCDDSSIIGTTGTELHFWVQTSVVGTQSWVL